MPIKTPSHLPPPLVVMTSLIVPLQWPAYKLNKSSGRTPFGSPAYKSGKTRYHPVRNWKQALKQESHLQSITKPLTPKEESKESVRNPPRQIVQTVAAELAREETAEEKTKQAQREITRAKKHINQEAETREEDIKSIRTDNTKSALLPKSPTKRARLAGSTAKKPRSIFSAGALKKLNVTSDDRKSDES